MKACLTLVAALIVMPLSGCTLTFPQVNAAMQLIPLPSDEQKEQGAPIWLASVGGVGAVLTPYAMEGYTLFANADGDAIAFDFRTLHGASGNNANTRRRAISFRLVGDDARICASPDKSSPAFPDLALSVGDALSGADFPVLYQA